MMHFTAVLVLESGMVRVVSFRIMFYLDHKCGNQLFCGWNVVFELWNVSLLFV